LGFHKIGGGFNQIKNNFLTKGRELYETSLQQEWVILICRNNYSSIACYNFVEFLASAVEKEHVLVFSFRFHWTYSMMCLLLLSRAF
jgi:hypothetical protein